MAYSDVPQLKSLAITWPPELQEHKQMDTLSTTVSAQCHVSLPWYQSYWPTALLQVERLQVCGITLSDGLTQLYTASSI